MRRGSDFRANLAISRFRSCMLLFLPYFFNFVAAFCSGFRVAVTSLPLGTVAGDVRTYDWEYGHLRYAGLEGCSDLGFVGTFSDLGFVGTA